MKRLGMAPLLGLLSFAHACNDEGSADPTDGETSTGDEAEETSNGSAVTTSATTTTEDPSSSADTTAASSAEAGESSSESPADTTDGGEASSATEAAESSSSGVVELCGNDTIDAGEICDGTDLGGLDCVTQGFDGGDLGCVADCSALDESACIMADCGNGVVEGSELCDGEDLGGASCTSEGYDAGPLGCSPTCMAYNFSACSECGDDDQDGDELCDGTDLPGLSCVAEGFQGGEIACAADCMAVDTTSCSNVPPCAEQDIGSAVGTAVATGSTVGGDDDVTQSCVGGTGIDQVLQWVAPADGSYRFDTVDSALDTVLSIHATCNDTELACNDQLVSGNNDSRIVMPVVAGELYLIAVNGYFGGTGNWVLNINLDAPGGPCCSAHGSYGCDSEPGCADAVCAIDDDCCTPTDSWSAACVALAVAECPSCAGICGNGAVDDVDEVCDGAALGGQTCVTQGFDYGTLACNDDCTFDAAACGDYAGDCCTAHMPAVRGCEDDACVAVICADDGYCCNTNWDSSCASAAATECAVCNPDVCGNNLVDGMGEVCDGIDLGGESCATQGFDAGTLVCNDDCATFDTSDCSIPGDCCSNSGGLGCDDQACTDAICGQDSFCCNNAWDTSCANAAVGFCTVCGGGIGDCCTETGEVGCNDAECVYDICGFLGDDPTCCSVEWTTECTDLATEVCPVCL